MASSMPYYFGITALATVAMQLTFFLIANHFKFDKVTDIAGTMNFLLLAVMVFYLQGTHYVRQTVLTAFVVLWAIRLGSFLLNRVLRRQKDARFDKMRDDPMSFIVFWILQMIWVWTTSLPVTIVNSLAKDAPINSLDYLGWILWIVGFVIEAHADQARYNMNAAMPGSPSQNSNFSSPGGIWHYSRHPNYFGEIIMWLGIFLSSIPANQANNFTAGIYLAAASPVITFLLLAFLSGIPLAEARSDKRYKDSKDYKRYKLSTSPLIPLPSWFYSSLPMAIRRIFFFEFAMYWKRFNYAS